MARHPDLGVRRAPSPAERVESAPRVVDQRGLRRPGERVRLRGEIDERRRWRRPFSVPPPQREDLAVAVRRHAVDDPLVAVEAFLHDTAAGAIARAIEELLHHRGERVEAGSTGLARLVGGREEDATDPVPRRGLSTARKPSSPCGSDLRNASASSTTWVPPAPRPASRCARRLIHQVLVAACTDGYIRARGHEDVLQPLR